MILGWDWPRIYEILEDKRTREDWHLGLLGEGANEDQGEAEGALWDLESLTSGAQFQEAQQEELTFRAFWETEITRQDQQMVRPELCDQLPHCEQTIEFTNSFWKLFGKKIWKLLTHSWEKKSLVRMYQQQTEIQPC
ncbi:hypothetical protein Y1Q_0008041 [Alligator mississippiensis]|uniref:Uncharacterized protein n=1 Tax=Alligator mississippiensis TaxID=8496 RepID=A0A151NFC2_ALLMI|nr:hypothetical protein Y1Q_0008041 [Alligator mississippiensis]